MVKTSRYQGLGSETCHLVKCRQLAGGCLPNLNATEPFASFRLRLSPFFQLLLDKAQFCLDCSDRELLHRCAFSDFGIHEFKQGGQVNFSRNKRF